MAARPLANPGAAASTALAMPAERDSEADGGHETVFRAIEAAACYDQWNAFNSSAIEVLIRKLQPVYDKHRDRLLQNQGHQDYGDDTHLYLGGNGPRGGAAVCLALQTWIAEELSRESAVLKERRKAREERSLARPK